MLTAVKVCCFLHLRIINKITHHINMVFLLLIELLNWVPGHEYRGEGAEVEASEIFIDEW